MSSAYVQTQAAPARPKTFPPEVNLPWSLPADAVLEALESDRERGLTLAEADKRLHYYGPNVIQDAQSDPFWRRYWEQLTGDAVVRLLLIGGIVSLLLGDYLEGVSIILMLNVMAAFGLWQEGRATDAARALREADDPLKLVIRDGHRVEIPASLIVPGDVIYLPTGAIAPADGRAIAAVNAEKDTSKLTGESHAVRLNLAPVAATTVVNEQKNMLHRGDALLSGNVTMVVTATGSLTEVGKIATRLTETVAVKTPLDEQLDDLGNAMTQIFFWIALSVIGIGLLREFYTIRQTATPFTLFKLLSILKEAFVNAVALIIAAIPEGLPAVLSITLAIATKVMVRRNALVRKPKAVEGSGSMTVLLTDKTGTLTANQMTVTHLYLDGQTIEADSGEVRQIQDSVLLRAVQIARKCNNNSDSTEAALLRWVEQLGFEAVGDIETRAVEHVFDQTLKRMTTVHESDREGYYHIFTKGAPEQVLQLCHQIHLGGENIPLDGKQEIVIREAITSLASRGLRVIALADRLAQHAPTLKRDQAETELVFVGLLGIMDPPRPDVASAVAQLAAAGVRSVMVTGDNPVTAYHIAKTVGIVQQDMPFDQAVITGEELVALKNPTPTFLQRLHTVRVFARVTPQHKAEIVQVMRDAGFIVGMTGDGVNDAIALKESDIGLAMGNGTDVAREAADVVLMDSRFSTIPSAVEEGRNVLHRIRLYLSYILSGNGCEVGLFIVAYVLNIPIPLTALVLLVINFATDSFPALAMAFEPGEKDVMARPPRRRNAPFINSQMWTHIGVQTVVATLVIIGVYYYFYEVLGMSLEVARAAAFMTYISQKLYRAFTARSLTRNIWEIGLFRNRWTLAAVSLSLSIALAFVYLPVVNTAVGLAALSGRALLIAALVGLIPPCAEEITKISLRSQMSDVGSLSA